MSLKKRLPVIVAALLAIAIAVLAGTSDKDVPTEINGGVNQEVEATGIDSPEEMLAWIAEGHDADGATEEESPEESWLMESERAGGHLLARHVGQTESQLASRLVAEPNISAASTFETTDQAEAAVAIALETNAAKLENWRAKGANGRLTLDAAFPGGMVLKRGADTATEGEGVLVVLQGNGQGSYYILTGYPTP